METTQAACNICGAVEFAELRGRPNERCRGCGALCRHRVAYALYERHGLLSGRPGMRVLHFAPEKVLYGPIADRVGVGYMPADAMPEVYPHLKCLKVLLPEGLDVFPDEYFDYVIHNHVLEHIPGTFRDHVPEFCRVLTRGGMMIFSVPGPKMSSVTQEGGEHLASDEERLEVFGQINHLKRFGGDLPEFLSQLPGGRFTFDELAVEDRAAIAVRPGSNRFLLWEKTGSTERNRLPVPGRYVAGAARSRD